MVGEIPLLLSSAKEKKPSKRLEKLSERKTPLFETLSWALCNTTNIYIYISGDLYKSSESVVKFLKVKDVRQTNIPLIEK